MDYMDFFNIVSTGQVLGPCKPAEQIYGCTTECKPNPVPATKKKGKPMSRYYDEDQDCYVHAPETDAADQRSYFKNRISQIGYDKTAELRRKFGLENDFAPESATELVKRIQDGKYVIKKEYEDKKAYNPFQYITWRDPAVKEDQVGFDAAWNAFEKAQTKARDAVMALSADKAMEAVQSLEAWTPSA